MYQLKLKKPEEVERRIVEFIREQVLNFQREGIVLGLSGGEDELKRGIAYYRVKHRMRMVLWYYYGELKNYLILRNCNKTEKLTGYFVKYGTAPRTSSHSLPYIKLR
jgi:NH3-dependent NAD+ synthetase